MVCVTPSSIYGFSKLIMLNYEHIILGQSLLSHFSISLLFSFSSSECSLESSLVFQVLSVYFHLYYRYVYLSQRGLVVRAKYFCISHARGHRFRTAVSKA